jgi:hypothetical protein
MPRPLFTPGKDPVPIVQEVGIAFYKGHKIMNHVVQRNGLPLIVLSVLALDLKLQGYVLSCDCIISHDRLCVVTGCWSRGF